MGDLKDYIEDREASNLPKKKWGEVKNPCKDSCPAETKPYKISGSEEGIEIPWPKTRIGKTISTNNEGEGECRQMTADLFREQNRGCYNIARECTEDGWEGTSLCSINALDVTSFKDGLYKELPAIENSASAQCGYNDTYYEVSCNGNDYIDKNIIKQGVSQCINPNYDIEKSEYIYEKGGEFTVSNEDKNNYIFTCEEVCAIKFSGKFNEKEIYNNPDNNIYQQKLSEEVGSWKCKIKDEYEQIVTGFYEGGKNKIFKNTVVSNKIDRHNADSYYSRLKIDSIYFKNEKGRVPTSSYAHRINEVNEDDIEQKINYCYKKIKKDD
jgi:hypothetical protein